jgi:hypothetical protein
MTPITDILMLASHAGGTDADGAVTHERAGPADSSGGGLPKHLPQVLRGHISR